MDIDRQMKRWREYNHIQKCKITYYFTHSIGRLSVLIFLFWRSSSTFARNPRCIQTRSSTAAALYPRRPPLAVRPLLGSNQVTEECAPSRGPPGIDYCDQFAMCSYLHYVTCIGGAPLPNPDTRNRRSQAEEH